jgi:hypothetical protein
MTKPILKYFWKFIGITFLIEILWYVVCFSIGYFYFPLLLRNIAMVGFLILPFFTSYHTMWNQIDELESFIETEFYRKEKEKNKCNDFNIKEFNKKNIKNINNYKIPITKFKKAKVKKLKIAIIDTPIKKEVKEINEEEEF